jgi:formate hydrogenlyase subunit 4
MDVALLLAQLLLALACAPLLNGIVKAVKAGLQNRRGPRLLQGYHNLLKYLGRESVASEYSSWLYAWAPAVSFAATLATAGLVPVLIARSPLEGVGDAVLLVGLLALARFALALAALDTASNFGGMGTSRELTFAALVEPALLLGLFALALPLGTISLGALVGDGGITAARVLALGCLFIVAIAETGRIPVDNPDTHLELTMAHEGMLLEYSGRPLGLLLWAAQVKQFVVLALLAALFFPWGIARDLEPLALAIGLAACLAKLALLGVALALVETSFAKLRIFRVPDLLGAASLLGVLAISSTYVLGG